MEQRIWPALIAVVFGSLLIVALMIPLVAANYRKYGRLSFGRIMTWAACAVYATALLTFTLLPLPETGAYECTTARFAPGGSIADIADYELLNPRALLTNPAVLQIVFNVLLFMPLGFFLRLLWGRGIVATTLAGLGITLFIETTQLTGLWGLYPCAYRLFDVDDLVFNTVGALLGAVLAAMLRLRTVEPRGGSTPRRVSLGRRIFGMVSDVAAISVSAGVTTIALTMYDYYLRGLPVADIDTDFYSEIGWWVALTVQLLSVLCSGRSIGDFVVNVRYEPGQIPQVFARPLRFLSGIGGYALLISPAVETSRLWWIAPVFALTILISAVATKDRSGLAGRLSGQRVVDSFTHPHERATG